MLYMRTTRHLMWIRRLYAELGERGRHTFVFLFQPFGESSRNRATYLQSRGIYLVILRKGNAAESYNLGGIN
jgi:hypothetical protein